MGWPAIVQTKCERLPAVGESPYPHNDLAGSMHIILNLWTRSLNHGTCPCYWYWSIVEIIPWPMQKLSCKHVWKMTTKIRACAVGEVQPRYFSACIIDYSTTYLHLFSILHTARVPRPGPPAITRQTMPRGQWERNRWRSSPKLEIPKGFPWRNCFNVMDVSLLCWFRKLKGLTCASVKH